MLIHRKNKVAKGGFPLTPFCFNAKTTPMGFSVTSELLDVFSSGEFKPMSDSDRKMISDYSKKKAQ